MSYVFDYTGKLDSDGFFKNESDIWNWCVNVLGNYESDLSYDYSDFHQAMALSVQDSVYLSRKLANLSQLPVRLDKVEGNLWLEHNQLTSLFKGKRHDL